MSSLFIYRALPRVFNPRNVGTGLTAACMAALLAFASPSLAETSSATDPGATEPKLIGKSEAGHTYAMPEDFIAVTVAPPAETPNADPLDSDLSIWVGAVEIQGRETLWVELIDAHGEVIYDSEVQPNETHLLPDGRAIAVAIMTPDIHPQSTQSAQLSKNQSRVPISDRFVVTSKAAFTAAMDTQVTLLEVEPAPEEIQNSFMLKAGENGETIWNATKGAVSWLGRE